MVTTASTGLARQLRDEHVPTIPSEFKLLSFAPATLAAHICALNPEERSHRREELVALRQQLSEYLTSRTPSWTTFTSTVNHLAATLRSTQTAAALSSDVETISTSFKEHSHPRSTVDVLNESERISANTKLLDHIKSVVLQMDNLKERESTQTSADKALAKVNSTTSLLETCNANAYHASTFDLGAQALPNDFVARASAIAETRAAAAHEKLENIDVLGPIRADLQRRHEKMRDELNKLLVQGVFGVPCNDRQESNSENADDSSYRTLPNEKPVRTASGSSFLPPLPLLMASDLPSPVPNPIGFCDVSPAVQDALPQIVQALDTLCGPGHSTRTIENAAPNRVRAFIKASVETECSLLSSESTMPTVKCFGFNRGMKSIFPSPFYSSFLQAPSRGNDQMLCSAILNRVCFHMLRSLRRLISLSNAVRKERIKMLPAIVATREQMEQGIVDLVNAFLGAKASNGMGDFGNLDTGCDAHHLFSLLSTLPLSSKPTGPSISGKSSRVSIASQSCLSDRGSWRNESPSPSQIWEDMMMRHTRGSFVPSVYNLELMHTILKRFSRDCAHSANSLKGSGKTIASQSNADRVNQFLTQAAERLTQTLRTDLREFIRGVVGKRAGGLLQPPQPNNQAGQVTSSNHILCHLPHMEAFSYAICGCLRMAISIPDVAQQIGCLMSSEILSPLSKRGTEALRLARRWTDAGNIAPPSFVDQGHSNVFAPNSIISEVRPHPVSVSKTEKPGGRESRIRRGNVDPMVSRLVSMLGSKTPQNYAGPELLSGKEWKAVVRLVHSFSVLASELQNWWIDSKCSAENTTSSVLHKRGSQRDSLEDTKSPVQSLRQFREALRTLPSSQNEAIRSPVREVLERALRHVIILEEFIISQGVSLLRAEVMARCYWLSVRSLRDIEAACDGVVGKVKNNSTANSRTTAREKHDAFQSDAAPGLNPRDETSRLYEFDEFGDRIPQSASVLSRDSSSVNKDSALSMAQILTAAENRMISLVREANVALSIQCKVVKNNLSLDQREQIFSGVDAAIAAGLKSGRRRDRAIAVAGRLLVQTLAVGDENLVGARTFEQSRALMYAAGMM